MASSASNTDVVIMVPQSLDTGQIDPIMLSDLPKEHHAICIETEADVEPISPKTITDSSK